jgi:hypothetical protein
MKFSFQIFLATQILFLSSFFYSVSAQEIDSLQELPDSLNINFDLPEIDSLDTNLDSIPEKAQLYPVLENHGSLFNLRKEALSINKTKPQEINYISVLEVVNIETVSQPFYTNAFGKRDRLGMNGYFQNATTVNGIQQFGVGMSGYNFWTRSADANENIEILEGAEAIPFANNSGGLLINFQEINYNTSKPFVRLWATDVNDDLLSFDGTWAQNVSPNWNVNIGYRSNAGNARFDNSAARLRNLRVGIRRTIDSNSQVNFSYLHGNNFVESNSGINPATSLDVNGDFLDSPVNSVTHFNSLNRRTKSHQIQINYSNYFDSTRTKSINILAYGDYNFNHQDFDELEDIEGVDKFNDSRFGANFTGELYLNKFYIKAIGNIESRNYQPNRYFNDISLVNYSVGGYSALLNLPVKPYASIKLSNFNQRSLLDFGAGVEFVILNIPFKFDYSFSNVAPNLYISEVNTEQHNLILFKTQFQLFNSNIELNAWNRNISNQMLFGLLLTDDQIVGFKYLENQNLNITGASLGLDFIASRNIIFNTDDIHIDFKFITNPLVEGRSPFPTFFANLNSYIRIPRGKSEANIGFNWQVASEINGYGFNDFLDLYYVDPYQNIPPMFLNLEFYARLRLNHAWLKISFMNPLGQDIYYMAHHRAFNQYFKMSFNWTIN